MNAGQLPRPILAIAAAALAVPWPAAAVVWPTDSAKAVTRSFGSDENGDLHGGIDIPGTREVTKVIAAANATIVQADVTGATVSDVTARDAAGNEYYYGHIQPLPDDPTTPAVDESVLAVGTALTEGTAFALIRKDGDARSGSFGHLHFEFARAAGADNSIDPLRHFFPANTVSETIVHHSMTFNPRGRQFPVYGQKDQTRVKGRFAWGDVDLVGELRDDMGGTMFVSTERDKPRRGTELDLFEGYSAVPAKISYLVDKPDYVRRGSISERTLEDFADKRSVHDPRLATVYDDPTRLIPASAGNSDDYSYWLTQTDGSKPAQDHYWNTDALFSGSGDGSTTADTLVGNANGLFQDGVYTTWAKGYTVNGLIGGTGLVSSATAYDMLLNNWKQTAAFAHEAGVDPGLGGRFTEPNPHPPETELSRIIDEFFVGKPVFGMGNQYVDDFDYTAYLLPHKPVWTQGDSLLDNLLASAAFTSDALGRIASQFIWTPDRGGFFDMVIDYDGDRRFSWTLDGVNGFRVVGEPSPAWLVLVGLAWLACRRGGWRAALRARGPA